MKFIGITGGVGAGKSAVLAYLSRKEGVRVMYADAVAHDLMQPGMACYDKIKDTFKNEAIFLPDGSLDREKTAQVIFADPGKRSRMNEIVHPAVKEFVLQTLKIEREQNRLSVLVLEAALLIEERYDEICDELWYIDAAKEIREARLMESRGYSREKVQKIFESQLKEDVYKKYCKVTIDNNGDLLETFLQIDAALKNLGQSD